MVDWKNSDMALLISDLVNDFFHPDGKIPFPNCWNIVPNVKMLCDVARENDVPIVFVGDSLRSDKKSPELDIWSDHCIEDTWGAEFIDILGEPTEYVRKEGFTPFFGKHGEELIEVLRELEVDTLIICGICTPEVKSSAYIAAVEPGLRDPENPELGWDIVIPEDCVGHCDPEQRFDAKKDLHLLEGDVGSSLEITTVWDLKHKIEDGR